MSNVYSASGAHRMYRQVLSQKQQTLMVLHGTPDEFAKAVYAAVPGDISMDEAADTVKKYLLEWTEAA